MGHYTENCAVSGLPIPYGTFAYCVQMAPNVRGCHGSKDAPYTLMQDVIVDKTIVYVEESYEYIYLEFADKSAFMWESLYDKGIYFPDSSKFGLINYLEEKEKDNEL